MNLARFSAKEADKTDTITFNCTAHLVWTLGSFVGALFGDVIGNVRPYGLDFALPGMFMALLLPHARIPRRLLAACLAALFSLVLAVTGAGQWNVMLATVLAATVAAFLPMQQGPFSAMGPHDRGEGNA